MPSDAFNHLLQEHAGYAMHRQHVLQSQHGIGDFSRWDADLAASQLSFTGHADGRPDLTVNVALLGTASEQSDTWLWLWGNQGLCDSLPPEVASVCRRLRASGDELGVPELADAHWPLDEVSADQLMCVSIGLMDAAGFYRGPYSGGAMYVLLLDDALKADDVEPIHRLPTAFSHAISLFELADHQRALRSYCQRIGVTVSDKPDGSLRLDQGSSSLTATFDAHGRLQQLTGTL